MSISLPRWLTIFCMLRESSQYCTEMVSNTPSIPISPWLPNTHPSKLNFTKPIGGEASQSVPSSLT